MNNLEWQPIARNYENERQKYKIELSTANQHPLQPRESSRPVVVVAQSAQAPSSSSRGSGKDASGISDPLSAMKIDPMMDPLSAMMMGADVTGADPLSIMSGVASANTAVTAAFAADQRKQENDAARDEALLAHQDELNISWAKHKKQIYAEYNVEGSITMSSAAYNDFEGSGVDDGSRTRLIDKYSQRLAGLEQRKLNKDTVIITQAQFEAHVVKLSQDLNAAWAREERQQSLKIVIQLAKLLADVEHPQFYPCMFVIITDVLEKFSDMVYKRLREKAEETCKLKADFTVDDVPVSARETCRNWFYKVAQIIELLPRLLVEITLLKCYRFLTDTEYPQILARLGSIARGLGNPLVSTYARMYLVYMAETVVSHDNVSKLGFAMTQDLMYSFKMLRDTHHQIELVRCRVPEDQYVRLLSPGVQWLMKQVGKSATKELFQSVLHQYRQHCNDAMVLGHIIEAFDASHYAQGTLGMVALVKASIESLKTTTDVFTDLGKQLTAYPPPEEQRMPVLNEVWKVVSKACTPAKISSYVRCNAAWMDLVQRHYSERELMILLSDLTSKLGGVEGDLPDETLRVLENILSSLIASKTGNIGQAILTSEHLLKIMDMFKGPRKVTLCMDVLDAFRRTHASTGDAVLINTMIDIGRNLHDSIDMLSAEGDRRHISKLLNGFIGKIDFGKDLEQQLNTYVECRAIFNNLDMVKDKLVECVAELAHKAYTIMHGTHSKKTAAFVKACLAYCHITIPSIRSVSRKLELLLQCATCALLNQCLPQTDTFLKAAISLIPDMPPMEEVDGKYLHTEGRLAVYLCSLLSLLVLVPGHPDHGPFYIVQGLLNAVPKYPWQAHTGCQTRVFINMLALLATYAQKKFPYSLPHVESNDVLYCSAVGYAFDLSQQTTRCVEDIMKQLAALGEAAASNPSAKLAQARLVLDMINQLVSRMELNKAVGDLLLRMLTLASTHKNVFGSAETAYFRNTVAFVEMTANKSPNVSKLPPQLRNWNAQQ